jgi:hypothetical protein
MVLFLYHLYMRVEMNVDYSPINVPNSTAQLRKSRSIMLYLGIEVHSRSNVLFVQMFHALKIKANVTWEIFHNL